MKENLIIPMYRLLSTHTIDDISYNEKDVLFYRRDYDLAKKQEHFEALAWAMENSTFDFKSVSPIFVGIKFSNKEVFSFLKKILLP